LKLVNDLYCYVWQGADNNCNSYLLRSKLGGNKHVLIDPGHIVTPYYKEPGLNKLLEKMKEDGLVLEDIGLVIITHAHFDHCEAANVIRERYGALVALHKADEEAYRRFGGQVDVYLAEGELTLVNQSEVRLQIYHAPGHSPGHIVVYWPEERALVVGDVIFYRSTGRVDFSGGDGWLLKQSIERLATLDVEYLLCGHPYSHPGIIGGKDAVQQNFDFIKRNIPL
jgi:glyoxylase-like metal-dependent hydrolase (beta-lactamase superfamily II)